MGMAVLVLVCKCWHAAHICSHALTHSSAAALVIACAWAGSLVRCSCFHLRSCMLACSSTACQLQLATVATAPPKQRCVYSTCRCLMILAGGVTRAGPTPCPATATPLLLCETATHSGCGVGLPPRMHHEGCQAPPHKRGCDVMMLKVCAAAHDRQWATKPLGYDTLRQHTAGATHRPLHSRRTCNLSCT